MHNCFINNNNNTLNVYVMYFLGRAALQKRIMALLRKIEHCVNGVQPVCISNNSCFIFLLINTVCINNNSALILKFDS